MKRFLQKLLLLTLIFWAANSAVALLLAPRIRMNVYDKYHWIMNQRGQHFHVAIVGSSRVENCIDALEVERIAGRSVINLGLGGGGAADQYLALYGFLKDNSADEVLLQLDYLTLMDYFSYGFRDYEWLCYDDDSVIRDVLIRERGLTRYSVWKAAPFVRLMEFSSQYRLFLFEDVPTGTHWDLTRGSQLRDTGGRTDERFVKFRVAPAAVPYLKEIVKLCREKGIRLLVFQTPYPPEIERLTDRSISDPRIVDFCNSENLSFCDFSRVFYDRPDLFYDRHHLTSAGSSAFSRMLGEWLKTGTACR